MVTYTVGHSQTIYEFLEGLKIYPQSYRLNVLLTCGAVKIKKHGSNFELPRVDKFDILDKNDIVSIEVPLSNLCQNSFESEKIPDSKFRDYVFVPDLSEILPPEGQEPFKFAKNFFANQREDNILSIVIDSTNTELTLSQFLQSLANNKEIVHPIRNIILVTHSTLFGLILKLEPDQKESRPITYIQLAKAHQLRKFLIQKHCLLPRPADSKSLPFFHIRGCNIGSAKEYLQMFKDALGGQVTVTAPKYADYFQEYSNLDKSYPGPIEFMSYEFVVSQPLAFKNKSEALNAFKDISKKRKWHLFDGTEVRDSTWELWINQLPNIYVNHNLKIKCKSQVTGKFIEFSHDTWIVDQKEGVNYFPCPKKPSNVEEFKTAMKEEYLKWDSFKSPYPLYRSFHQDSIDEWLDSYDYVFSWSKSIGKAEFSGWDYYLKYPILKKDGTLIMNYYPTGSKGGKLKMLDETDSMFFERV